MPQTRTLPPDLLAPGDRVELTDAEGRRGVHATVTANDGARIALRLAGPFSSPTPAVRLHRLDGVAAWQADGIASAGRDPLTLTVEVVDGWEKGDGRAAMRFQADRRLVRLRGTTREVALDLVALDVSATGCCVSGSGMPPSVGTRVWIDISASSYMPSARLHATVVRSYASAFGRFELGLRFDPRTPVERDLMLQWRDETALVSARLPLELVAP
jgi:hypothetical protein